MTQDKQTGSKVADWHEEGKALGQDPRAMLDLPEGLLALEGLPITFGGAISYPVTEAKVLEAAQHIIDNRQEGSEEKRFHSQASVMSHASHKYDWLTGPEMRLASIPNYMNLPPRSEELKTQEAEGIDGLITALNSGMFNTREGSRKLLGDDSDGIWDRHEASIEEAKMKQRTQMDEMLAKIREERGEAEKSPEEVKKDWASSITDERSRKRTSSLGM